MNPFKQIVPIVLVLLLPACQRQAVPEETDVPEVPETQELVEHTLYASTPGEEETRTVLDDADPYAEKILWSVGESISVLPAAGGNYQFTGDNAAPASSASFTGSGPVDLGDYIALYPYNSSASYDGTYVSTTLPSSQTGKAGSFADGYLITADDASGNSISFNHVCSGLRFQVSTDNIKAVSIRGHKGERMAGNFRFSFPSADTPVARDATEDYVTLTAPGGHFEPGKYYFIVILPTTFSSGFSLVADNGTKIGELSFDSSIIFHPGKFKTISLSLDDRMTWSDPKSQVYYGPQNTFCLRPGETLRFDVLPRLIYGAWQRSGIVASGATHANYQAILWQNGTGSTASLDYDWLTISAGSTEGTALVAIKNGSTIIWSYLIWVTSSAPAETTLPGGAVVLPPLGGNCYFQWGRKDPLLSSATQVENNVGNGLAYAIAHPETFIKGTDTADDWFCQNTGNQDGSLWGDGGLKTVWDPCPEGYRVPSESDYTNVSLDFTYLVTHFAELGYISSIIGFESKARTYWTRTVGGMWATSLDDTHNPDIFYGQTRDIAAPIRCVKE